MQTKTVIIIMSCLMALLFLVAGGAVAYGVLTGEGLGGGDIDRTTDTWSNSFTNEAEKLAFLQRYLVLSSRVSEEEYHVFFQDNSGGPIPGPSDWDITAAFLVEPENIPSWTRDFKKVPAEQVDMSWWEPLETAAFSWETARPSGYYKRSDSNTYVVVYEESGIVLKMMTTMRQIPKVQAPPFEGEKPGYGDYKSLAADRLECDRSFTSFIKTQQAEQGLLAKDVRAGVILMQAYLFGGAYFTPVLAVDTGGQPYEPMLNKTFTMTLTEGSYESKITLADIDGDGYDEILAHHCYDMAGGYGNYETAVYKLIDGKLEKLFYFPGHDTGEEVLFDTGFGLTLSDGWQYTVENRHTGYSDWFNRDDADNPYFDSEGKITEQAAENNTLKWLGVDPYFYLFDPVDADSDGTAEIAAAQYTYLRSRSEGIGTAYSLLKWDKAAETFRIAEAGFWPYRDFPEGGVTGTTADEDVAADEGVAVGADSGGTEGEAGGAEDGETEEPGNGQATGTDGAAENDGGAENAGDAGDAGEETERSDAELYDLHWREYEENWYKDTYVPFG